MERYDKKNIELPKEIYEKIETDVVNLYLELELNIPLKAEQIAIRLGYIVKRMSEIKDEEIKNLLRFDKDGCRRDGYSFFNTDIQRFEIWVNNIDSFYYEHDDFTIMHEIGHIRLGHLEESDLANRMANYYAAYSLVPSPLFWFHKLTRESQIIEIFKVSDECASRCYKRCLNWEMYSGEIKPYERRLLNYYKKKNTTMKQNES